ncbi:MAG: hypothetical protein GXP47_11760 [Acidobacteria bacterium]|nr:hypothetical protein [Acidobacteriota bacterium]
MNVRIEKVDWHLSEAIREGTVTFSIDGKSYTAFSSHFDYKVGAIVDVRFDHLEEGFSWEDVFHGNPNKQKCLTSTGEWSYDAFGQIVSINPVQADFGPIVLELGEWTHDERVVGEYIYWRISRLDVSPQDT